jgi:peptidoglycan/LPS O-acetylase OafA/YrhL/lysophospholipase L1-like esterase
MHHRGEGSAGREPALDGLRAVAVTLVLLFHGGMSWMPGGYLGVSLFFTLSGFLITRLLLAEVDATGTIGVGAFYARRARRLLPASLLCLAAIAVAARVGEFDGVGHLRRDLLGAIAQVYNWVQLGAGGSYGDLVSSSAGIRSPLDHYWSLAIEEQFYWLWPLVLLAGVAVARRRGLGRDGRRRALTRLVIGAAALSALAAPLIAVVWGPDAAYWATPARAAEILLGAAAAALHGSGRLQRVPTWTVPAGLAAIVALSVALPSDRGFAYHGGLVVVGLISATVLLGLRRPSPTRRLLSARPLVAVGAVSYGLYLFHWPVFVLLDPARTGLDGAALFACRIAVTVAVTIASYWIVEQPVRRATWAPPRTLVAGTLASFVTLAAIAAAPAAAGEYWTSHDADASRAAITPSGSLAPLVAVHAPVTADEHPGPSVPPTTVPATAGDLPGPSVPATTVPATTDPAATPPATVAPSRPVRILVIGDSTAEAAGTGLTSWALDHPDLAQVSVLASGKCGMVRGGEVPGDGGDDSYQRTCEDLVANRLLPAVQQLQPDVVAIFVVARDSEAREWDPHEGVLTPTDPRYAARIEAAYRAVSALIVAGSPAATVVWVRPPTIDPYWKDTTGAYLDADGHAVVDSIAAELAAEDPAHAAVVDLRTWMESTGYATREDMRPDGIHFTPEAARQVAEEWLGPELVATALR